MRGRVVVCGTASISRWDEWPTGPRVERHLLVKRARMGGFVIFDHMDRYGAALEQLRTWIAEGRLKWEEDIQIGRAHVSTPVTNAHLVCRLLLEKKKQNKIYTSNIYSE